MKLRSKGQDELLICRGILGLHCVGQVNNTDATACDIIDVAGSRHEIILQHFVIGHHRGLVCLKSQGGMRRCTAMVGSAGEHLHLQEGLQSMGPLWKKYQ